MRHITMIILLFASCVTANYEDRCQITDEGNCPGNGGGGSPPSDQDRSFAAVDVWAASHGYEVIDRTCDVSGSHCSSVHTTMRSINAGFFTVDCTITTVTTNGSSTSTASCYST